VKSKKELIRLIAITTTVLTLALLYFFIDARYTNFFPRCPFFTLTGLYCPGCGSQRAVSALLHGKFLQALNYNAILVASLPFIIYSAYVTTANAFGKHQKVQKIFYSPVFVKIVFCIVVIFAVLRNIPAYPFTVLAP